MKIRHLYGPKEIRVLGAAGEEPRIVKFSHAIAGVDRLLVSKDGEVFKNTPSVAVKIYKCGARCELCNPSEEGK